MSTPVSASSPYLTATEFLLRYDVRTIGQLMHDDDALPVDGSDNPDYAALKTELLDDSTDAGANLAEILMEASGYVEASCLAGERYTPTDLQTLTGASLAFLKRLVAWVAIDLCYQRRPTLGPPPAQAQQAQAILNAIAGGTMIFGLQEAMDAGHMKLTTDTPAQVVERNSSIINIGQGFFGIRGNRRLPRGGN